MTMRNLLAFILPILLMSGCLSSAEVAIDEPIYESETVQEINDNQSYQYWNIVPMGMGNESQIVLNGSGQLNFTLELTAFFHEPLFWEQGAVNYSLIHENETIWSVELNQSIENYNFTMENMSGNITVQIQSNGSDDQTDNKPGDFYIAKAVFTLKR